MTPSAPGGATAQGSGWMGRRNRAAAAVTSLKLEAEGPVRRTVADVEELIERVYARL